MLVDSLAIAMSKVASCLAIHLLLPEMLLDCTDTKEMVDFQEARRLTAQHMAEHYAPLDPAVFDYGWEGSEVWEVATGPRDGSVALGWPILWVSKSDGKVFNVEPLEAALKRQDMSPVGVSPVFDD